MNALLDTHTLLWWVTGDRRLSRRARELIGEGNILISVVSLWEIEIKRGLKRIVADTNAIIDEVTRTDGFYLLDLRAAHISSLAGLPPLHRDPFDRILAAQAQWEHVPLISGDRAIRGYPIEVEW